MVDGGEKLGQQSAAICFFSFLLVAAAAAPDLESLFLSSNIYSRQADQAYYSQNHPSLDLESVKKRMKTLAAKVNKIYGGDDTSKVVKVKVVVGFKEEVNKLIEKLDGGEGKPLEIISIIGAGGGGKSTLAREVYDHSFTSYTFGIRAWVNVSHDYNKTMKRDLLIRILESLIPGNYENSGDAKLGEEILKYLKGKRYLIVMDDIWGIEAWNDVEKSFPKECKGSKVLFTSRQSVQLDSDISYITHILSPLPDNWCWELLQEKVFGMNSCPPELVGIVYEGDSFSTSIINKHQRLFIGHQFFEKFSLKPRNLKPRNLRSFLCLSLREKNESRIQTNFSFFVENFELLRVLNFLSGSCYGEIGIGHLVHLRYLAYAFYGVRALPFSYLLNLETLNLESPEKVIKLPRDIFKMVKLRHLYTKKGVFNFHLSPGEAGSIGFDLSSKLDSLQTLHRICACEACRSLLVRTPNLRKLGVHGGIIQEDNVLRFPDIECFQCLETFTFSAYVPFDSTVESTLPLGLKLPRTITRITLKNTCLKWEELSLLETLPSLEVLRLIDYACCGPVWNTSELNGFPELKYLRFYDLDIKKWIADDDKFPKLEVLVLDYCRELEQIPIDFGNLNELREIKLEWCRSSAEESAREIQKEQRDRNGDCLNLLTKNNWD
ncbi:hypothetical protein Vadar_008186 [Vaccinium darrowii]|uniref:Uncharacterized protein n=1 Tax=Vaccinium darrowii TaxID=229202 RepID=A0ACB7XYC7_9ERIC|nr:hypothetical protein Vadar_008186 [Vaccinium darrowii]